MKLQHSPRLTIRNNIIRLLPFYRRRTLLSDSGILWSWMKSMKPDNEGAPSLHSLQTNNICCLFYNVAHCNIKPDFGLFNKQVLEFQFAIVQMSYLGHQNAHHWLLLQKFFEKLFMMCLRQKLGVLEWLYILKRLELCHLNLEPFHKS